jgi:hydrogenase maturation protein HypF
VRTFPTTSVGRLFDTAAALLGFTRDITFEGQAAMWVEHMAHAAGEVGCYSFPFLNGELDFRPLLQAVAMDRIKGRNTAEIARAFQRGIAGGVADASKKLARTHNVEVAVLSGGVFQNELLLEDLKAELGNAGLQLWTNQAVPANDGGISLGQAALAFFDEKKSQ